MHRISGVRVLGAGQKEELREKQGHPAGGHPPRTLLLLLLILLILLINAPPYFPSPAVQALHANLQLKWLQFGRFIHSKYKSRSSWIFREPATGSSEKLLSNCRARGRGSIAGALG